MIYALYEKQQKVPFFALFRLAPTKFIIIICTNLVLQKTFKIVYNKFIKAK